MNNFTADSTQIDDDGITALRSFFSPSLCLVQKFETGGSCPIFDGDIWVYEQGQKNKNNGFTNKIPVQIKSSQREWKDNETFPIKKAELQNYRKVGGIIFLRPIFKSVTDYKIYVKSLLPVDITEILLNAKIGPKSVSVQVEYCENVEKLELLIDYFLENQKHQFAFDWNKKEDISIGKDESLVLKAMGKKNDRKMLFNSYMYIKDKRGHLITTSGRMSSFEELHSSSVLVGDKEFFKSYKIRMEKEKDILILNSVLEIELNKEKAKTSITAEGNTSFIDLLNAMKFMKEVSSKGEFHTDDGIKASLDGEFAVDEFFKFIHDADTLLDKYKIDKSRLLFSDVVANETVITMLSEKMARAKKSKKDIVFDLKNLFNKKLLLCLRKVKGDEYSCVDFVLDNLEDGVFHVDDIKCSKYIYLLAISKGELHEYIDIFLENEEAVISDLKTSYTLEQFVAYNNFALECIKGYDKYQALSVLSMAKDILSFLNKDETAEYNKKIIFVNNCQVLYRMKLLSDAEKVRLADLKKDLEKLSEVCCLNLLLDEITEFEDSFKQLSTEEQENFKSWPIWNLYIDNLGDNSIVNTKIPSD